jgi:peptidoglycan/LPS O-acetylase OafA/YrhL
MSLPVPAEQTQLTHPKYRADIDGLRAIAVLSVVGFHAFPLWVKGGFIGVDIFFVISGFLISSIIFDNLERNCFSFAEFYSRRINRIFPALFIVLAASFAFGWLALFPDEYKQLGMHIAGGAGFVSNFILSNENGYFANSAAKQPLLHLWSLGIEEQFYIVWPLLLAFVWKRKWSFVAITATIAASSFAFNIYTINKDPTAAFYLPASRSWELMIGGLLAYIALHLPNLNKQHKNVQSIFGCMLIALGLAFLGKERMFPGWWALLPALGTFFLISAGPKAWFNRHVLSNKLLVWVGLISYPLYLWHWPLLSFARIVEGEVPSRVIRISAVLISIALGWLTYRFVEKPIRFSGHVRPKAIVSGVLMMVIGFAGFGIYEHDGENFRNDVEKAQDLFQRPVHYTRCSAGPIKLSYCSLSSNHVPTRAIFGDSHAAHLFPGIAELDKNNTWLLIGNYSCPPIVGIKVTPPPNLPQDCQKKSEAALEAILKFPSIDTVVISFTSTYTSETAFSAREKAAHFDSASIELSRPGLGPSPDKVGLFYSGLEMAVTALEQKGKSVVIVIDVPELPFFPRDCIRQSLFLGVNQPCKLPKSMALESQKNLRAMLGKLTMAHTGVRLYDSFNQFCGQENCNFENNDMLFYRDSDHLSLRGSIYFAKYFLNWMSKNRTNSTAPDLNVLPE